MFKSKYYNVYIIYYTVQINLKLPFKKHLVILREQKYYSQYKTAAYRVLFIISDGPNFNILRSKILKKKVIFCAKNRPNRIYLILKIHSRFINRCTYDMNIFIHINKKLIKVWKSWNPLISDLSSVQLGLIWSWGNYSIKLKHFWPFQRTNMFVIS